MCLREPTTLRRGGAANSRRQRLRSQEAGESPFSLGSHGTHQPHLPPHRKHFILVPIRLNKAADAFFYLSMKISFWTSYKILLMGDLIYSSSLSFALYFCLSFCLASSIFKNSLSNFKNSLSNVEGDADRIL